MISLNIVEINSKHLRIRERLVEALKVQLVIKPLQYLYRAEGASRMKELNNLADGTVGKDVAQLLESNNLSIIPKYEDHDLKHLILGYGMTSMDEIAMQAYLFGNGNRSLTCVLFLSSGLLFPEYWKRFYGDYKSGKEAPSILDLTLKNCMLQSTEDLRETFNAK